MPSCFILKPQHAYTHYTPHTSNIIIKHHHHHHHCSVLSPFRYFAVQYPLLLCFVHSMEDDTLHDYDYLIPPHHSRIVTFYYSPLLFLMTFLVSFGWFFCLSYFFGRFFGGHFFFGLHFLLPLLTHDMDNRSPCFGWMDTGFFGEI